jgi:sigma-B regulation protein RsbU (phosphoserine phosphatase)
MQVLIAEDDPISRKLLELKLDHDGYDVVSATDGGQAWAGLVQEGGPKLAILDWMMPVMDGTEVCRRVRAEPSLSYVYVILLTAKSRREDRSQGFEAGADDYLTKPFDTQDLRARVAVGRRIIELQTALEQKVGELRDALTHVKQLQGLLPICMYCKKIRDDESIWHQLESYIETHSDAAFTHSLCLDCMTTHYPGFGNGRKVRK